MTPPGRAIPAVLVPGVTWSVCIRDAAGRPLLEHRPDDALPTASVGKVLLLLETARRLEAGLLDPAEPLARDPGVAVADSGLWQHLSGAPLPVADLAALVGAVSDNWATNVLLDRVGADAVRRLAADLGLVATGLHDRVRDVRDVAAGHPPTLSTGSAAELSALLLALHTGGPARPGAAPVGPAGARVLGWLRMNADLSMVGAGLGLDPLAHTGPDLGLLLANKTGTDAGIRADVGLLLPAAGPGAPGEPGVAVGYAVLARWPADLPAAAERRTRLAVLAAMRDLGGSLAGLVSRPAAGGAAG